MGIILLEDASRGKWKEGGGGYFQASKNKWLVISIIFNLMDIVSLMQDLTN